MANSQFQQFFWTKHTFPVLLDCNFIVDPANGNGLGIRTLKGPGVKNVFMHTTASFTGTTVNTSATITGIASGTATLAVGEVVSGTGIPAGATIVSIPSSSSIVISSPATASGTVTISYAAVGNPNPASGVVAVQLSENYFRYYGGFSGFEGPLSGSTIPRYDSSHPRECLCDCERRDDNDCRLAVYWCSKGSSSAVGLAFVATSATPTTGAGAVQGSNRFGCGEHGAHWRSQCYFCKHHSLPSGIA